MSDTPEQRRRATQRPEACLVLGIDAATPPSSVALVRDGLVVAAERGPFGRKTDAWVLPAIERVLGEAGVELPELAAIAAGAGPGTFTGIRVAIATAQGLGRGAGIPVAGVSTLTALARCAEEPAGVPLLPTIDARRGQIYCALATRTDTTVEVLRTPWLTTPEALLGELPGLGMPRLLGTGATTDPRLADLPRARVADWPQAGGVALFASALLTQTPAGELPPALPLYLREPDARVGRNPLAQA